MMHTVYAWPRQLLISHPCGPTFFFLAALPHKEKIGCLCPALVLPTMPSLAEPAAFGHHRRNHLNVLESSFLSLGLTTSTLSLQSLRAGFPGWWDDRIQNNPLFYLLG